MPHSGHRVQEIFPHSSEIEGLLNSNEAPPAIAVQELQKFLKEPLRELEDLDAQIKRLTELKSKRDRTREIVILYGTILSPLRRFPCEVLQEIFFHCLPNHRNSIISASEAPVLLTHVCSKWRAIVHQSPRMWSRIHIPFSDDDVLPRNGQKFIPSYLTSSMAKILPLRCQIVHEWLSRSGNCPLSISVYYTTNPFPPRRAGQSEITTRLLNTLARFSHRWQNISLSMPNEVFYKLESLITTSDLPMLDTYTANILFHPGDDPFRLGLLKAKHLKEFNITASSKFVGQFSSITPNLTQLTRFTCNVPITVEETAIFLKTHPKLIHLSVYLTRSFIPIDQGAIHLPYLVSFVIHDTEWPERLGNICERIEAPQLRELHYRVITGGNGRPCQFPIVHLLQKSEALKKLVLSIHAKDCVESAIRHLLCNANSISHLVLGTETRNQNGSLWRKHFSPLDLIPLPPLDRSWSFDEIFSPKKLYNNVDNWLSLGTFSTASAPILLPSLEVLEISHDIAPYFSDNALHNFVLDRLDSSHYTATLKRVSAVFGRPKEREIANDIHQQAGLLGTTIELELDYLKQDPRVGRTSPKYGLEEEEEGPHD